jgi:Concanavalin A-like lectin/glucanases superfamily
MHQPFRSALLTCLIALTVLVTAVPEVASAASTPSAPTHRTVTPCPMNCAGNVAIYTRTPTLSAWARDAAGDVLTYQYEVYRGTSTTPAATSLIARGTSTPVSATALDKWTVPSGHITATGYYEYRVRAAPHGTTNYGPWSMGWIHFNLVFVAPTAPTVTLSGVGTSPGAPAGTVGHAATVHLSDADPAVTYIAYSVFAPVDAVPTEIGFPLHCGFRSYFDAIYVCRNADGTWPSQQIAPIATSGAVWAASINARGETSTLVTKHYYADADQTGLLAGHSWIFEPTAGTPGYTNPITPAMGPVPDTAAVGATALAHGNGVSLALGAPNPAARGVDPATSASVPAQVTVSVFNGAGSESTANAVLDPHSAFTVGAWVKVASTGRGIHQTLLSQMGGHESSFYLQNSNGFWTFCMPETDIATYHGPCVYQYKVPVQPGKWTFVAGAWNPANQSLTVYTGDGTTLNSLMRSSTVAGPISNGPLFVGQDTIGTTQRYFTGSVVDPFAVPASLTTAQLEALMAYRPPSEA